MPVSTMLKAYRRPKSVIATVATTVCDIVVPPTKHWPLAVRQDFAFYVGLNDACQESQFLQQQMT